MKEELTTADLHWQQQILLLIF